MKTLQSEIGSADLEFGAFFTVYTFPFVLFTAVFLFITTAIGAGKIALRQQSGRRKYGLFHLYLD